MENKEKPKKDEDSLHENNELKIELKIEKNNEFNYKHDPDAFLQEEVIFNPKPKNTFKL